MGDYLYAFNGEAKQEGVRNLAVAEQPRGKGLDEFEPSWGHWQMGYIGKGGDLPKHSHCIRN